MSDLNPGKFKAHAIKAEDFLARWAPALLAVFALVYYAQYFRYGLNLGGEGGTNAVLAMRLMEDQRPIVDTFLGYNLLWFYPLVALFKITGPSYLAMRLFFFVLCTINAVLGYIIVRTVTRQAWLALFVGVLLVLVPGMIFRNYMGLIGILSSLLLLKGYVLPARTPRRQIIWMTAAGAGMTATFLLRIEPSLLITVVWLGLAVLYPFGSRRNFAVRLRTSVLGTLAGALILVFVHSGVAWHAYQRGFGPPFVAQYGDFVGLLKYELVRQLEKLRPANGAPVPAASAAATAPAAAPATTGANLSARPEKSPAPAVEPVPEARLARPEFSQIWTAQRPRDRYFGLCLYFPILWSVAFAGTAAVMLVSSVVTGNMRNKERALVILTTTGCALSLFPQYFFFRPDAPHLSEFMVPFLPALACSSWVLWESSLDARRKFWRIPAMGLAILSAALVPVYLKAIMPRESAGTIFSIDRPTEFMALNGVNVLLPADDAPALEGIRDAVLKHSERGEFVLVYPYAPTINFMTDRPSYEYNLYTDDSVAGTNFQTEARERIEKYRPAVIVIDNRPINQTERSRFKNWASGLMDYIRSEYPLAGSFRFGRRDIEVYARPDKLRRNQRETPVGTP